MSRARNSFAGRPHARVWTAALAAALILALLAGCGGQATAPAKPASAQPATPATTATPPTPVKVTVGALKLNSSAPIFVGLEKGFWKALNVDVEVKWFEAAQPVAVAVAAGEVDVGATGLTAGLYNLVVGGQKMLIVADKGRDWPGYRLNALVASSAEANAGLNSVKQLKGKKIGLTQLGSTFHYQIGNLLEQEGLSLPDVQLTPLRTLPSVVESLQSNQVAAAMLSEPNVTKAVQTGAAKVILWSGDKLPYQVAAIFYSPKFAANREAAVRFMQGYIQAQRYYYDAVLQVKDGKPAPGPNGDEVLGIIAKYTGLGKDAAAANLTYMDRDAALLTEDIGKQIAWYRKAKLVEKDLDAAGVVDLSFQREAVQKLGK